MLIKSELKCIRLSDNRTVYRLGFDPSLLDHDELRIALELLRAFYCPKVRREFEKQGIDIREIRKDALCILSKAIIGDGGSVDPAMHVAPHILLHNRGAKDLGLWWCDGGSTGKMFTVDLCTDPYIYITHRAIAINPWSLDNLGDLDTIMDGRDTHKEGTLGTGPFSVSYSHVGTSAYVKGTFNAKTTGTIRSVIVLSMSDSSRTISSSCYSYACAPPGTCHDSYYASIYMPVWGFDTNISITEGIAYAINVRLYV